MMIIGGLAGFSTGLVVSLLQENGWHSALWRASVGACIAGFLMRWWAGVWAKGLREVNERRLAEAADKQQPPNQKKK
jgi:uncharacterized membrane protein YeaQ/YmgE (transglycosylase-associated protein family)